MLFSKVSAWLGKYLLRLNRLIAINEKIKWENLHFKIERKRKICYHLVNGMLVIFAVIGIIILATKLVNFLFSE